MKYASKHDVDFAIQVLQRAIERTKDSYVGDKITPSLNRVIFELEDLTTEKPQLTK